MQCLTLYTVRILLPFSGQGVLSLHVSCIVLILNLGSHHLLDLLNNEKLGLVVWRLSDQACVICMIRMVLIASKCCSIVSSSDTYIFTRVGSGEGIMTNGDIA